MPLSNSTQHLGQPLAIQALSFFHVFRPVPFTSPSTDTITLSTPNASLAQAHNPPPWALTLTFSGLCLTGVWVVVVVGWCGTHPFGWATSYHVFMSE